MGRGQDTQLNKRTNRRRGILICGAYGLGNAGDESILKAILQQVRLVAPEEPITVLSRNPEETRALHGVNAVHMFHIPKVLRLMETAKLYLNGGGSLIQNVTSRRSLHFYLFALKAAKRRGCKVLMYGCGIGPVRHKGDIRKTGRILNECVDKITLRDDYSLRELHAFGVTRPEVVMAADPAIMLDRAGDGEIDEMMRRLQLEPRGSYIAVALRDWPGFSARSGAIGKALVYAYERYGVEPVFLPINHISDTRAAHMVTSELPVPHHVIQKTMPVELTLGLLSRMQAAISMRLHGLIFAASQGVPLIGVAYDPKVTAFLAYMGQSLSVDLDGATRDKLCGMIDDAMAQRDDRHALEEAVSRLREMERHNSETLRRILEEPE